MRWLGLLATLVALAACDDGAGSTGGTGATGSTESSGSTGASGTSGTATNGGNSTGGGTTGDGTTGGSGTGGGTTGGGTTGSGTSGGSSSGSGGAPQLELCAVVNGSQNCLSQDPHLTITFPAGPVGTLIGPIKIEASDLSPAPLEVTAITLDSDALAAGYSIVETNLGLPRTLSTTTGLTVPFHIVLSPTQTCTTTGCLHGSVSVSSNDPHYPASDPARIGLVGTGT